MNSKEGLPRIWLMTDERNDAKLEQAIDALPRASGIIFRHYGLEDGDRHRLFRKMQKRAKRQGHMVLLADSPALARQWKADGVHGRGWKPGEKTGLLHSAPVHNFRELAEANQNQADVIFLSPAFTTRSHPNRRPLNRLQLRQLVQLCRAPVILLGGMNLEKFNSLNGLGAHGWAAIDALMPSPKS